MRETKDGKLHYTKKGGKIRGITFGYDYCTEQEIGLSFWKLFTGGVETIGAQGRVWINIPEGFKWFEVVDFAGFGYNVSQKKLDSLHPFRGDRNEFFAWSNDDFVVLSRDKGNIESLRKIFDLAGKGKLCFCPATFFAGGSGMCVAVASSITNELKEQEQEDRAKIEGKKAWEKAPARTYLDNFRRRAREQGKHCYYPCYLGPPSWGARRNDNGEMLWWLNDSRPGRGFGSVTDAQAIEYIKSLEKEFSVAE